MNKQEPILISVDTAAELLSMTRQRLLRLTKKGVVPCVDLGDKELRYSAEGLREWVRKISRAQSGEPSIVRIEAG